MMRRTHHLLGTLVVLAAVGMAVPASAQTGGLRGKVVDKDGKPVEGAKITIEAKSVTRKLEVKTNKKGEYIQIGIFPGEYKVTVEKDGIVTGADTRVGLGDPTELNFDLRPAGPSKEQQVKLAALQKLFDEGVTASKANDFDTAIAKFQEAAGVAPNCHDCYYNIGYAYSQKKDWEQAEAAYKKATEVKPDYADAWNALANIYNQQKKLDEALAASTKASELASGPAGATGGGNAAGLYNQGVILWNQNKFLEARDKFEAATKADPKYSEAYYRLGMANVNLGKMPEAVAAFEGYLAADPDGKYAAEVKQFIAAMKPK